MITFIFIGVIIFAGRAFFNVNDWGNPPIK